MSFQPKEFGLALRAARMGLGLTQAQLGDRTSNGTTAIFRWEKGQVDMPMESRIRAVRALADAPAVLLDRLAAVSGVSLSQLGLAPQPVASVAAVTPGSPVPNATAQSLVDDALREAAEEADVSPKLLRPALSRMLDRMARAGVPMDAAARMVLGVPKKDAAKSTTPAKA